MGRVRDRDNCPWYGDVRYIRFHQTWEGFVVGTIVGVMEMSVILTFTEHGKGSATWRTSLGFGARSLPSHHSVVLCVAHCQYIQPLLPLGDQTVHSVQDTTCVGAWIRGVLLLMPRGDVH